MMHPANIGEAAARRSKERKFMRKTSRVGVRSHHRRRVAVPEGTRKLPPPPPLDVEPLKLGVTVGRENEPPLGAEKLGLEGRDEKLGVLGVKLGREKLDPPDEKLGLEKLGPLGANVGRDAPRLKVSLDGVLRLGRENDGDGVENEGAERLLPARGARPDGSLSPGPCAMLGREVHSGGCSMRR
jgi:hypothetical protein